MAEPENPNPPAVDDDAEIDIWQTPDSKGKTNFARVQEVAAAIRSYVHEPVAANNREESLAELMAGIAHYIKWHELSPGGVQKLALEKHKKQLADIKKLTKKQSPEEMLEGMNITVKPGADPFGLGGKE